MANPDRNETWRLADELLELAKTDTAFADLFLERARALLAPHLSEAQYAALADLDAEVANLTNRIAAAMEEGDWRRVQELTGRVADVKRSAAERAPLRDVAARVYGFDEILVDPFSPGICGLAGVLERELPSLRDAALVRLERLRAADPAWADLYEARRRALADLRLAVAEPVADEAKPSVASLRARAQKALADGDLAQLQQLSAQIVAAQGTGEAAAERTAAATQALQAGTDLLHDLARDVRERAGKLGLAPHRVESTAERVQARFRPSWRPTLPGDGSGNSVRLSVAIPGDTPEALRDTLELLMNRAFVTSAGTRYMPRFLAEDVLVEDFDEPAPGGAVRDSPLLAALGLPGRWGLARRTVERALRERGGAVVRDLGLDPRVYRVGCLPTDVFTRLGSKLGWGKREIWTHFDGYMASRERKLLALVGGDVRFGGLHDLVAVGADYDSDRLFARFAVVQRRRFATW